MESEPEPKPYTSLSGTKRIVVACDGTWKKSDGEYQVPSNVTRICRSIKQEHRDEKNKTITPQIIYYQSGVGTESTIYNKVVGGSTGQGKERNQCYDRRPTLTNMVRTAGEHSRSILLHLQQLRAWRRNLLDWIFAWSVHSAINCHIDSVDWTPEPSRSCILLPDFPRLDASNGTKLEIAISKGALGEPSFPSVTRIPSQAARIGIDATRYTNQGYWGVGYCWW